MTSICAYFPFSWTLGLGFYHFGCHEQRGELTKLQKSYGLRDCGTTRQSDLKNFRQPTFPIVDFGLEF